MSENKESSVVDMRTRAVLVWEENHNIPLEKGSGGGDSGGMDPRIAALEKSVGRLELDWRELRSSVDSMKNDVSYIKGRIEGLPTTWAMITAIVGGQVAFAAVIFTCIKFFGH